MSRTRSQILKSAYPTFVLRTALLVVFGLISGCGNPLDTAVNMAVAVEADADAESVREHFEGTFNLQVPQSHKGGISLDVRVLGQSTSFQSLIPNAAQASEIFEGGQSIKYNPGAHTMVVAFTASGRDADEKLVREQLRALNSEPDLKKVFLQAGTRKIAAYERTHTSFGQENLSYQILLSGGHTIVLTGPEATFDHEFKNQFMEALVNGHPANEQLYAHVERPALNPNAACGVGDLPNDYEIQLVHIRRGQETLKDQAIDPTEAEAYLQPVTVGRTEKPVVVILMSGEPTVWKFSQTKGSRLAGVVATGRNVQRVIGLPSTISVLETKSRSQGGCRSFYAEQRDLEQGKYPDRIWETFAQDPRVVHLHPKPSGFQIGELDSSVTSHASVTLQDVVLDPNKQILPGKLGIAQLLKRGVLRPGSAADFEDWLAVAPIASDSKKVERQRQRVASELQRERLYVINESTELPLGMGGSNSMQFVAAADIASIPGDISHNTIYFADGRCKGPACPR